MEFEVRVAVVDFDLHRQLDAGFRTAWREGEALRTVHEASGAAFVAKPKAVSYTHPTLPTTPYV